MKLKSTGMAWVCRDLSNGDGADPGVVFPTYVWAFNQYAEALRYYELHRRMANFAELARPERRRVTTLRRLYRDPVHRGYGTYFVRKSSQYAARFGRR